MFNIMKWLGGFNIFNGEKLGKLVFYAVLIIAGIGIYHKVFVAKTNITKIERVEKQIIMQDCPSRDRFVGIQVWKLKVGLGL